MMLAGWPDVTVIIFFTSKRKCCNFHDNHAEIKEIPFIYSFSGLTVASEETSYSMGTRELGEGFRETR